MRFNALRAHNMGVFRDFSLDLTALPGPLVALAGPNGSGKTTALELMFGGVFRECPTRGSLADLATARDSFVEVQVSNGKDYTFRQSVDATSRKGETLITNGSGVPLLASTKVRDADNWVAQHLPSKDTILASLFCAQQSSGFLGMQPGERKSVLLKLIGVEKLERLAEAARERARDQRAVVATLAARVADERARGGDVAAIEVELSGARAAAEQADASASDARQKLDAAKVAAASAGAARDAYAVAERAYRERARRREELAGQLRDLEGRIANNRSVLEDRERIESAVAAVARLREEVAAATADVEEANRTERDARREATEAERERASADAARVSAERRARALASVLSHAEEIEQASRCLPGLRRDVERAEAEERYAAEELERLQGQRVAGAEERVGALRGSLDQIRRDSTHGLTGSAAGEIAGEALREDDAAVQAAHELPQLVAQVAARGCAARERSTKARRALQDTETVAAQADRLEADRSALVEAQADVAAELERGAQAAGRRDSATLRAAGSQGAREGFEARLAQLSATLGFEEKVAAKAAPLAGAEARLAELEPQVERAREELRVLEGELSAGPPPAPPLPVALDAVEHLATRTESEARAAAQAVAVAKQRLEQARAASSRVAELEGQLDAAELDLADWTRLAADLGRDGLQAAEIDAAGPELTELVNDLLHRCLGPRFTVSIETQRMSADGKRTLEGCEVRALDVERGRDTTAETLSGGEAVLVGEAVSLALATLACRRAGVERPTLVRDESGAALSPENARVYVSMLRRAAELIGADKVLLVSHTPEVWDLCDARVDLAATS